MVPSSIKFDTNYWQTQVFTKEEETIFPEYLKKASCLHHGLSTLACCKLAFYFASHNSKKHP